MKFFEEKESLFNGSPTILNPVTFRRFPKVSDLSSAEQVPRVTTSFYVQGISPSAVYMPRGVDRDQDRLCALLQCLPTSRTARQRRGHTADRIGADRISEISPQVAYAKGRRWAGTKRSCTMIRDIRVGGRLRATCLSVNWQTRGQRHTERKSCC